MNNLIRQTEKEVSKLIGNAFRNEPRTLYKGISPPLDVVEMDDCVYLFIEMPGVDKDGFHVVVENDTLTVAAKKQMPYDESASNVCRRERLIGSYVRAIQIPKTLDKSGVKGEFSAGVLKITIPKLPSALPNKVTIDYKD